MNRAELEKRGRDWLRVAGEVPRGFRLQDMGIAFANFAVYFKSRFGIDFPLPDPAEIYDDVSDEDRPDDDASSGDASESAVTMSCDE